MKVTSVKHFVSQKSEPADIKRVCDVMIGTGKSQPLACAENLSIPSFQVVVMRANMRCSSCRERVHKLLSKMTGFQEYSVDLRSKEVIIKGDVRFLCNPKNRVRDCKSIIQYIRNIFCV